MHDHGVEFGFENVRRQKRDPEPPADSCDDYSKARASLLEASGSWGVFLGWLALIGFSGYVVVGVLRFAAWVVS